MTGDRTAGAPLNAALLIEQGRWHSYQKFVLLIVALALVFDGMDNQLLSFAVPALIAEWGVERSDFSPIFALGFVGMSLGTMVGGAVGDRIGRRLALIGAVALFGAATLAISFVPDLFSLGALRILSGFGLGAAMPVATAMVAEFTPLSRRSLAVALIIVCIPLGGLLGGVIAAQILPGLGWRTLFVIGGTAPLVVAALLAIWLPESPAYLAGRPERAADLDKVMGRMGMSSDGAGFAQPVAGATERSPLSSILAAGYLRDTLSLWLAFFMCILSIYMVFSWMPALLSKEGFDLAAASSGLAIFNFGGLLGSIGGALAIQRFGSRVAMLGMAFGGIAGCIWLAFTPLGGALTWTLWIAIFVAGTFINGVQTTLYGLAAHVYPGRFRASGIGAAAGVGRLGAIASAYAGAMAVSAGSSIYFIAIAGTLGLTFIGLAMMRRHSPRVDRAAAGQGGQIS